MRGRNCKTLLISSKIMKGARESRKGNFKGIGSQRKIRKGNLKGIESRRKKLRQKKIGKSS